MGHVCKTCGAELPSPGGLGIHELSHLTPKPKPAPAPAPAPEPERAKAASKRRTRSDMMSTVTETRRRRPSRAMSSGRATLDRPQAALTEADLAPAGRGEGEDGRVPRRGLGKLDSTIPVTALLVVLALFGGVVAALAHSSTPVNLTAGEGVVGAGASATGVPGPIDESVAPCAGGGMTNAEPVPEVPEPGGWSRTAAPPNSTAGQSLDRERRPDGPVRWLPCRSRIPPYGHGS